MKDPGGIVQQKRIFSNEVALGALSLFFVLSGLLLIYSTSSVSSFLHYGSQYHFFMRQFLFACVGLALAVALGSMDYRRLRVHAFPLLLLSGFLLLLLWVPGLGKTVRGARRWLDLGLLTFQPSELIKVILVFYLADRLSRRTERRAIQDVSGYLRIWVLCLPFLLIVLCTRDLGSTVILGFAVLVLLFLAGARLRHLGMTLLGGVPLGLLFCMNGYRLQRLLNFWDPWKDPYGAGYQLVQSFLAFGRGGVMGVGLGNGTEKLFYLPDAHTDFIFAVLGEELGLVGCLSFLVLFLIFLVIGVRIALRAPDRFGMLLAAGLTFLTGFQMILNVGIVMGLLPTKGMALPFISYGGSALLVNLMVVGLLISIARQGVMRSKPRT